MVRVLYGIKCRRHNGISCDVWCTDYNGERIAGSLDEMKIEADDWQKQNPDNEYVIVCLAKGSLEPVIQVYKANGLIEWLTR